MIVMAVRLSLLIALKILDYRSHISVYCLATQEGKYTYLRKYDELEIWYAPVKQFQVGATNIVLIKL